MSTNFPAYSVNNPCKDCPKQGCGHFHDRCEKYLQFKKDLEKYKAHRKELNENSGYYGAKPLGSHYYPKNHKLKPNPFNS